MLRISCLQMVSCWVEIMRSKIRSTRPTSVVLREAMACGALASDACVPWEIQHHTRPIAPYICEISILFPIGLFPCLFFFCSYLIERIKKLDTAEWNGQNNASRLVPSSIFRFLFLQFLYGTFGRFGTANMSHQCRAQILRLVTDTRP